MFNFVLNPARRTILYVAPCSGIRRTYKREQSYLFIYERWSKQNLL